MVIFKIINALIEDLTNAAIGALWRLALLAVFLAGPIYWVVK